MQTQSFLWVSTGQDALRWKKPLFSLFLFLPLSSLSLSWRVSFTFSHTCAILLCPFVFLPLPCFSFLSVFRASVRAYGVTLRPTRGSWILWQELVRRASDRNLPRRTCRRCSDSNIKLIRSLSIPLGGLVYRLSRSLLCGFDKRTFYKGAYSLFDK